MKKLVFAAIAAMVMVSVSNVFASNKMASVSTVAPVDTVAPAEAPADTTVKETELQRIEAALKAAGGNKSKAAQLLAVDRKTLYNKMKKYGI